MRTVAATGGVKPEQNKAAFAWGRLAAARPEDVARIADLPASPVQTLEQMIERRADFLTGYQTKAARTWGRESADSSRAESVRQERVALGARSCQRFPGIPRGRNCVQVQRKRWLYLWRTPEPAGKRPAAFL